MVDFLRKRLQVFISSTYVDLQRERQAAVESTLVAGHIPAGMELFTAGDQSQMDVIKQWIDESDVYLLILGTRYGSIEPKSGKSYVELEYDYAFSRRKPIFCCVISEGAIENKLRSEGTKYLERTHQKELESFRQKALSRISKFWDDHKDIKITVSETLATFSRREDLIGWVRASVQVNSPAIAEELARLSKENQSLRAVRKGSRSGPDWEKLLIRDTETELRGLGLIDYLSRHAADLASSAGHFDPDVAFLEPFQRLQIIEPRGATGHFGFTPYGGLIANLILKADQERPSET